MGPLIAPRFLADEAFDFALPEHLIATAPVELTGGRRDDARMLVAERWTGEITDTTVRSLPRFLSPGDLIVVNTSATLAAALPARHDTGDLLADLSTELPGGLWVVEIRRPCLAGSLPYRDAHAGMTLDLPAGGGLELLSPYPADWDGEWTRLWVARLDLPATGTTLHRYLAEHGRPIRYGCVEHDLPISAYQTVFSHEPGSAEMPSAARPFTAELVTALVGAGIGISPIVLHTGVSSQEAGEPPYAEQFRVPPATAERVNAAHDSGHRVVAVGTTVTRALESATDERGRVHPAAGWTELVVSPERGVRAIDGLITGWHEPRASHLALLEAVAGRKLLAESYQFALDRGYRWHEFGDLHLVLP